MIISVENIKTESFIGIYPEEKINKNFFSISVSIHIPLEDLTKIEKISDTIDYSEIYNIVLREMEIPCNLIEEKIKNIANILLKRYPQSESIVLKISKLKPIGMEKCDSASVEITIKYDTK